MNNFVTDKFHLPIKLQKMFQIYHFLIKLQDFKLFNYNYESNS